jgi:hypothetical protein
MPDHSQSRQALQNLFMEHPCWEILPLAERLNYSIPSVRRFLVEVGYHGSFTHNGRWYTLASIPKFDRDGLWFHGEIGFSRLGSLTRTLVKLVEASPSGLSAEALGAKLHCRCHSILIILCRQARLERRRHGRAFVYLSATPAVAKRQWARREPEPPVPGPLPAEVAILVLAEFIRNPDSTFADLASSLAKTGGIRIDSSRIEMLFADHGLKKTR